MKLSFSYERDISYASSTQLGLSYGNIETSALDESGEQIYGKATFTSYGGGLIFGGKFIFNDMAVLDVYLGPSFSSGETDVLYGEEGHFAHFDIATGLLTGLSFRAGIAIGFAF